MFKLTFITIVGAMVLASTAIAAQGHYVTPDLAGKMVAKAYGHGYCTGVSSYGHEGTYIANPNETFVVFDCTAWTLSAPPCKLRIKSVTHTRFIVMSRVCQPDGFKGPGTPH